jgi:hypothetical protein
MVVGAGSGAAGIRPGGRGREGRHGRLNLGRLPANMGAVAAWSCLIVETQSVHVVRERE